MSDEKKRVNHALKGKGSSTKNTSEAPDRRKFLLQAGAAATVATVAAGVLATPSVASAESNDLT